MEVVSVREARRRLSRFVERAAAGEEVVISRYGRPVARLVPFAPREKRRTFGRMRGKIMVADDFDAPLPDDLLAAFYGDMLVADNIDFEETG
jgi:prevent-host-death family protein